MSTATDIGALGCDRDHETAPHHHLAEQDRLGEGSTSQGAVRADNQVRSGHSGREGARHSDLGSAQVQHRGDLRVPRQEGPRPTTRLHQQAKVDHHSIVRRQQAWL